jgi:hypothetical protein
LVDLADKTECSIERLKLEQLLKDQLDGEDKKWVVGGTLVGLPAEPW